MLEKQVLSGVINWLMIMSLLAAATELYCLRYINATYERALLFTTLSYFWILKFSAMIFKDQSECNVSDTHVCFFMPHQLSVYT